MSTDSARAVFRIRNGVVALIKQIAPEFVSKAGLSKCGVRLETLSRGPTQWSQARNQGRAPP